MTARTRVAPIAEKNRVHRLLVPDQGGDAQPCADQAAHHQVHERQDQPLDGVEKTYLTS